MERNLYGCKKKDGDFVCKFHLRRTSAWHDDPDGMGDWVENKERGIKERKEKLEEKYPNFDIGVVSTKENEKKEEYWIESRIKIDSLKELMGLIDKEGPIVLNKRELEIYDDYRE